VSTAGSIPADPPAGRSGTWVGSLAIGLLLAAEVHAQVEWRRSPLNPLVPFATTGGYAMDPVVIRDEAAGVYRMWYTAYSGTWQIHLALSTDGIHWFTYVGNPVLSAGSAPFESGGVSYAGVVREGSGYRMLYTGVQGGYNTAIGTATSPDGIEWTRYPGNPVLSTEGSGWDSQRIETAHALLRDDIGFRVYYTGYDGVRHQTGLATSVDGVHWTKHPENPVLPAGAPGAWDDADTETRGAIFVDGTTLLFYTAQAPGSQRAAIGIARSLDGVHFERLPANPVLTGGGPASWDWTIRGGCPTLESTSLHLWYAGTPRDAAEWSIGLATTSAALLGVEEPGTPRPESVMLAPGRPNPMRAQVSFEYTLAKPEHVRFEILDVLGRRLASLVDEEQNAGRHACEWRAPGVANGVYIARLSAGPVVRMRKLAVVR